MVSDAGDVTLLETNTSPSMYRGSLFALAAETAGLPYLDLCNALVSLAVETTPARSDVETRYLAASNSLEAS
jgi:hypothetical protein